MCFGSWSNFRYCLNGSLLVCRLEQAKGLFTHHVTTKVLEALILSCIVHDNVMHMHGLACSCICAHYAPNRQDACACSVKLNVACCAAAIQEKRSRQPGCAGGKNIYMKIQDCDSLAKRNKVYSTNNMILMAAMLSLPCSVRLCVKGLSNAVPQLQF